MIDWLARALQAPLEVGGAADLRDVGGERHEEWERDAIVVLGAPLRSDGTPTQVLAERIAAALALWHAGGGRVVIACGGVTGNAPRAEGHAIAEGLRAGGVPDEALLVDDRSRTTAENAREAAALLGPRGGRTVWVVTQPFHARRALRYFARAGLAARAWHIADSIQYREPRRALRWLVREYAAWLRLLVQ